MPFTPENFAVWVEIPARDLDRAIAFYNAVFQFALERDESGPNPMAVFPVKDIGSGVGGHLYPGAPPADGAGPTPHFAAPDGLEDALARVGPAGGEVVSDPIPLPGGYGRFAYCKDSEGNSIGLFEAAGPGA